MARPRTLSFLIAAAALPAGAAVEFARDIQPILAEHCLLCHGPDDSKGGLTLTSFELATKALKSGAHAIVPGQPDKGTLLERLRTSDPDEQMPPPEQRAKKPVTEREMALLRQWIAEGAKFERHWAYQPVVRPPVPVT